jgi:hypothetical protein
MTLSRDHVAGDVACDMNVRKRRRGVVASGFADISALERNG